jgi:hypothetical protein
VRIFAIKGLTSRRLTGLEPLTSAVHESDNVFVDDESDETIYEIPAGSSAHDRDGQV